MMNTTAAIALMFLAATTAQAAGEPLVNGGEKWELLGVTVSMDNGQRRLAYIPVYSIGFYEDGKYVEVATMKRQGEVRYLTEEESESEGLQKGGVR